MDIRIETSVIADGNMSPRWGDAADVARNRAAFLARIGIDSSRLVLCRVPETNGTTIVMVGDADAGSEVLADALITRDAVSLGLLTADCLPVIMHDRATGMIAIAHCGWKSTDLRLAEKLVVEFAQRGSDPQDIRVCIGPSIRAASYVRPLSTLSQKDDPRWVPFIVPRGDRAHVDLHGYIRAQCIEVGVLPEHMEENGSDTYADVRYFSHRRSLETGEREGRILTVVSR